MKKMKKISKKNEKNEKNFKKNEKFKKSSLSIKKKTSKKYQFCDTFCKKTSRVLFVATFTFLVYSKKPSKIGINFVILNCSVFYGKKAYTSNN